MCDDDAIELTENSRKVLERRYLRRDTDGTLLETPAGMFYRVALHVAHVEEQHNGHTEETAETFYNLHFTISLLPQQPDVHRRRHAAGPVGCLFRPAH